MTGKLFNSASRGGVGSREVVENAIERSKDGRNTTWEIANKRSPTQQWESGSEPVEPPLGENGKSN